MAAGFQYFDHESSGAPSLGDGSTAGSLVTLLDWILVSKGGWSKPFSSTSQAVYRADSGNRKFLKIDDRVGATAVARGYNNMTSLTAGTGPFPTISGGAALSEYGILKQYANDTGTRRYWGVRTDKYILLIIEVSSVAGASAMYRDIFVFGEVPSLWPADINHNSVCMANNFTSALPYSIISYYSACTAGSVLSAGAVNPAFAATPDGSITGAPLYQNFANTPNNGTLDNSANLIGGDIISDIMLMGVAGAISTMACPVPRSKLPNLKYIHNIAAAGYSTIDMSEVTLDTKTFKVIAMSSTGVASTDRSCVRLLLEKTDTGGAL